MLLDCLTIALPTELIHSSFSLSESAMKNMVSLKVDSSKACALLITSSAPLMDKHLLMSITPLGMEVGPTDSVLNQKIFPCLRINHLRLHVLMYSPCLVSHPQRSGECQNSTPPILSSARRRLKSCAIASSYSLAQSKEEEVEVLERRYNRTHAREK